MSRKLPPSSDKVRGPIFGPLVNGYTVGDWCPTPDGSGKPTAVGLSIHLQDYDILLRLKSPNAVDTMIQALLRHKRSVWPDAP